MAGCRQVGVFFLLVSLMGCERESQERVLAHEGINKFKNAIVNRDSEQLFDSLSSALQAKALAAAREKGVSLEEFLLSTFEHQRQGLIGNLGDLVDEDIPIEDVEKVGTEFAVRVALSHGQASDKRVYFVLERGGFRFSGTEPAFDPASAAVSAANQWHSWPHWYLKNDSATTKGAFCGNCLNTGGPCDWKGDMIPYSYMQNVDCTTIVCTWFGSRCTYTLNNQLCYYQVIGVDIWWDSEDKLNCYMPIP